MKVFIFLIKKRIILLFTTKTIYLRLEIFLNYNCKKVIIFMELLLLTKSYNHNLHLIGF